MFFLFFFFCVLAINRKELRGIVRNKALVSIPAIILAGSRGRFSHKNRHVVISIALRDKGITSNTSFRNNDDKRK